MNKYKKIYLNIKLCFHVFIIIILDYINCCKIYQNQDYTSEFVERSKVL